MRARSLSLALGLGLAVSSTSACTTMRESARAGVIDRAMRDLDCARGDVRVVELRLQNRWKAIGCGQTREYMAACDGLQCTIRSADEGSSPWHDRPNPDTTRRP
jgi:hypothetical protein